MESVVVVSADKESVARESVARESVATESTVVESPSAVEVLELQAAAVREIARAKKPNLKRFFMLGLSLMIKTIIYRLIPVSEKSNPRF
jgi:hypothetical protein